MRILGSFIFHFDLRFAVRREPDGELHRTFYPQTPGTLCNSPGELSLDLLCDDVGIRASGSPAVCSHTFIAPMVGVGTVCYLCFPLNLLNP